MFTLMIMFAIKISTVMVMRMIIIYLSIYSYYNILFIEWISLWLSGI